jgi:protein-tyrosine phosphatase
MIQLINGNLIAPQSVAQVPPSSSFLTRITTAVFRAINDVTKYLIYVVSLAVIRVQHYLIPSRYQWSNTIVPGVVLGAIPIRERFNAQDFKDTGFNVLTLLEEFERKATWVATPLKASDYQEVDVGHKMIEACDFRALSLKQIDEGVAYIEASLENGQEVYVHCKAGRGRSAQVVIAYVLKHGIGDVKTVDEAIAYVKQRRSQISINSHQKPALVRYKQALDAQKLQLAQ